MNVDVELTLDLREYPETFREPSALGELWAQLEPALYGRTFAAGEPHVLQGQGGVLRLQVMRTATESVFATSATRFAVVGVRERAIALKYRCSQCPPGNPSYGPFVCRSCSNERVPDRLCDEHVDIIDGSLAATCARHHPGCADCGASATFRCAGRRCSHDLPPKAHCDAHRRSHPTDKTLSYCLSCYATQFPPCEAGGCGNIGSVSCEHVDGPTSSCAVRACPKHAHRWQVYGGERVGLARCGRHATISHLSTEEVIRQIVVGSALRRRPERLPRLVGFQHNIRKAGHGTVALPHIQALLGGLKTSSTVPEGARRAIDTASPGWTRECAQGVGDDSRGRELTEQLRALISSQRVYAFRPETALALANGLKYVQYRPAGQLRDGTERPARLFVDVPEDLRGLFKGRQGSTIARFSQYLGVDVFLEGRAGRR